MIYFTSDTHFGDNRLDLNGRDLFVSSADEADKIIIKKWNESITDNDTVFHLGDVAINETSLDKVEQLKGQKILLMGNYDCNVSMNRLKELFIEVRDNIYFKHDGETFYLNHYPEKGVTDAFNIVGHIHSLWKVQRNMINVSCDAWQFRPVPIEKIHFLLNAIRNHYDINVFAGELEANIFNIY